MPDLRRPRCFCSDETSNIVAPQITTPSMAFYTLRQVRHQETHDKSQNGERGRHHEWTGAARLNQQGKANQDRFSPLRVRRVDHDCQGASKIM